MVMSRFSRRERSAGIRQSLTLGSGTWTVPYGKNVIRITARGGTGSAASGGTYWYDYSSYTAAYTDPPVQTSAAYTDPPVVTTAAYNDPPVLTTPASYSPGPYVNTYVEANYSYTFSQVYEDPYAYYQTSTYCPNPTYTYKTDRYTAYYCEDNYGPAVYNPAVYSPGPYHPAVYGPGPYHPAVYGPGPYHPASYYAGYTVYYPYNPATTGAATTIANTNSGTITFPGGYATTGPVSSQTLYNEQSGKQLTITVPSGGYVTIDTL